MKQNRIGPSSALIDDNELDLGVEIEYQKVLILHLSFIFTQFSSIILLPTQGCHPPFELLTT